MGPAPAGTTAALPASAVACRHAVLGACGAGGSGVRSQAPFAVALAVACQSWCWWGNARRVSAAARERGPESAYPDRLPARPSLRTFVSVCTAPQAASDQPRGAFASVW